ncbi:MAG: hypothetical protein K0S47_1983 [Herbinix sp.]|jgi:flagellar basal-body rod modification protein FlgD|nr:hypothetical protein [Herbinix sp.]
MSDLIQNVKDGVVEQPQQAKSSGLSSSNALGKDAFLQLLVTQMKYQDPLNPNTDTQFIAQLATFSQLEQMQNISSLTTNSQAFSMVGKNVIIKTESAPGNTTYLSGKVDFVNMSGGKAQISVNGKLYSIDQLDSVLDDAYVIEKGLPRIDTAVKSEYDLANPKDITFQVNLGEGEAKADDVAILVGNKVIDTSLVSVSGDKVTINKDAFSAYETGSYKLTVVFNNSLYTTVTDKVTVDVKNSNNGSTNSQQNNSNTQENDTTNVV